MIGIVCACRDQRITQDVDKLCSTLSQIMAPLIISPFTIAYYIYKSHQRFVSYTHKGILSILLLQITKKFSQKIQGPTANFYGCLVGVCLFPGLILDEVFSS
ncbi:hypothetical protein DPMN_088839 [Dreissena polymorpha]|uniref:ABC transmembrane type-1 domain-containing protein n=1 Tax=Dreissena polymorpha TaxID=45954 RepID=A0A9D4KWL5_DREPO|nr:hypothetical protein DPMN_088839 [Dreissena polymorpha]